MSPIALAVLVLVAGSGPGASAAPEPGGQEAARAELDGAIAAKRAVLEGFLAAGPAPAPDRVRASTRELDERIAGARLGVRIALETGATAERTDRRAALEASARELAALERRLFEAFVAGQDRARVLADRIEELRLRAEGLERSAERYQAEAQGRPPGATPPPEAPAGRSRAYRHSPAALGDHDAGGDTLWAEEKRDAARREWEEVARLRTEVASLERELAGLSGAAAAPPVPVPASTSPHGR